MSFFLIRIEREVSVSVKLLERNFFLFVSKFRGLICSKYWILLDFVEIESKGKRQIRIVFLLISGRFEKRVASCEIIR